MRINLTDLRDRVRQAAHFVDHKAADPTGGVLICCVGGAVRVVGSDAALRFESAPVPAEDAEHWPASGLLLSARRLLELLELLEAPELELQPARTATGGALLRCGTSSVRLLPLNALDYPGGPAAAPGAEEGGTRVSAPDLLRALSEVESSITRDTAREGLNGLHIEHRAGLLRFVATDGSRLAWGDVPAEDVEPPVPGELMPRVAVEGLMELAKAAGDGVVTLSRSRMRLRATTDSGAALVLLMIPGDFPDYRLVIPPPVSLRSKATMQAAHLRAALRTVGLMVADTNRSTKVEFSDGCVRFYGSDLSRGDAVDEIACTLVGKPIAVGLNAAMVLDLLDRTGAREVVARFGGELDPSLWSVDGRGDHCALIMPLRLA